MEGMVLRKDVEDGEEVGLQHPENTITITIATGDGSMDFKEPEGEVNGSLEKSVNMEKNGVEGTALIVRSSKAHCSPSTASTGEEDSDAKQTNADIREILNSLVGGQADEISSDEKYVLFKLLNKGKGSKEVVLNMNELEETDEEEIELEFERAVEQLDQHSVHCPKCNSCITKVVLRKRKDPDFNLYECLSCLCIWIRRTTAGCLSCFDPGCATLPGIDGSRTLEILKSTVYGGLMESITSLSIVSSAAAADATTVNVVAIGLANLIGGLLIMGPNLRELKNGQADRYKELLGQRENFLLHATVAVLSFLFFGLIPAVAYGFSFRQSDDKDLKLVVVAAASLLCIALLAIGNAYIKKPPKFYEYVKTVLYYVSMAVMASGISYAVGDLFKRLMEKLGWFDSNGAVALPLLQVGSVNPALGYY